MLRPRTTRRSRLSEITSPRHSPSPSLSSLSSTSSGPTDEPLLPYPLRSKHFDRITRIAGATTSGSPLVKSQALEKSSSSDGQAKKRRRGSSTAREGPASKSPRVQPVPLPESAQASPSLPTAAPTPPSAIPPYIISGDKPSSSRSRVRTTSPSRAGTSQAREDARVAREARTEARSRLSTPTTAVVLPDDNPLPRVPRVGMGEEFPRPAESDVRAEGMYLIQAAGRRREEDRAREEARARDEDRIRAQGHSRRSSQTVYPRTMQGFDDVEMLERPASVSGWHSTRPDDSMNGSGDPRSAAPRRFWKGQNGSSYPSNHRNSTQHPVYPRRLSDPSSKGDLPVFYHSSSGQPSRSRYSAVFDTPPQSQPPAYSYHHRQNDSPSQPSNEDFDTQFTAIQDDYSRRASSSAPVPLSTPDIPPALAQETALGRGVEDAKPPKFHTGQRPTVVLAPSSRRPRDRLEREHSEGFDGLTQDVMADCDGFVDNVRVSPCHQALSMSLNGRHRRTYGTLSPTSYLNLLLAVTPSWKEWDEVLSNLDGN